MRLITVTGEGRVEKSPDTIELKIELVTFNENYEKMIKDAINKLNLLNYQLMSIGFKKEDIKTSNFIITTKYENVKDINGNYKNEFVGYEAIQNIELEFPMDIEFLGETIGAIKRSVAKPNISISFTIQDKSSVIDELLVNAVEDAKRKANTLANASGVRLGNVQAIDYKKQDYRIYSDTNFTPTALYSMEKLNIVPKDIELFETVNISFEII